MHIWQHCLPLNSDNAAGSMHYEWLMSIHLSYEEALKFQMCFYLVARKLSGPADEALVEEMTLARRDLLPIRAKHSIHILRMSLLHTL